MEKELQILRDRLGSWKKVASLLEITERYCRMIRQTGKIGKHLARIIKQKAEIYR